MARIKIYSNGQQKKILISSVNIVKTTAQTLTTEEQAQARINIDAAWEEIV